MPAWKGTSLVRPLVRELRVEVEKKMLSFSLPWLEWLAGVCHLLDRRMGGKEVEKPLCLEHALLQGPGTLGGGGVQVSIWA